MDKKEIAKDLTIAFLDKKPSKINSVEDLVTVYEKFYDAVHRSDSLVDYSDITTEEYIRKKE
ncbi:TPA: hypothetical protein ACLQU7_005206 [Bacillus tropicus]|uniref:hypothetical protein n=1 Tax=Bacillus tropicus TaxID=2026188 RepID=UPI00030AD1B5|nr:hypothetical protein [Bacillus tropicus]AIY72765.1 hypothetical protein NT98_5906 [Bacillus cereus]AJI02695.1 hypothetical protein AQ16_5858 [Bacillus cereus G9241]QPS48278.1 hypothetical protein I6G54_00970 [Bacillus tropicus]